VSVLRRIGNVAMLLISSLLISEVIARLVFRVPEVIGFNRANFTPAMLFGGLESLVELDSGHAQGAASTDGVPPPGSFRPIRNLKLTWSSDPDDLEVVESLNLYGFRGPDFAIQREPGIRRVLFIGDSFCEGIGVADDETIPRAFERLAGDGVEVINLGVAGTGLAQYARLASIAIPLLRPDTVVVVAYSNDFPVQYEERSYYEGYGIAVGRIPTWLPRLVEVGLELGDGIPPTPFYHRGPFLFFLPVPDPSNPLTHGTPTNVEPRLLRAMALGRLNPMLPRAAAGEEERLLTPIDRKGAGERYWRHFEAVASRFHANWAAAFIPSHVSISDHYYQPWEELGADFQRPSLVVRETRQHQQELGALFAEIGVPFVDVTGAALDEERRGRRLYHRYDSHMNAAGYALVAARLHNLVATLEPQEPSP
jgi:lysophospholipase L1-like esterase